MNTLSNGRNLSLRCCLVSVLFWGLFLNSDFIFAQSTLPVGSWRVHPSYFGQGKLTGSQNTLFYQSSEGTFYLSMSDSSVHTLTVLDGLASQNYGAAVFHEPSKTLVIAHTDGTLDFVSERNIRTNSAITNNDLLTEKAINNLVLSGNVVYVLGDFGVGIVDVLTRDFLNTWTNLGPDGTQLSIYGLAEDENHIYLATASGILSGLKNTNLNDFRNWSRSTFTDTVQAVSIIADKLVVLSNNRLFIQEDESFDELFGINAVSSLRKVGFQNHFLSSGDIYEFNENGDFQEMLQTPYSNATDFISVGGDFYLAVPGLGIVAENGGFFIPKGPAHAIEKIKTNQQGIFALGRKIGEQPMLAAYANGTWENRDAPDEVRSIEAFNNAIYIGTFNQGLWTSSDTIFEEIAFGIMGEIPPIQALAVDSKNQLWVGIFNNENAIYKINAAGQVEKIQVPGLRFPKDIIVDQSNNLWILQELGNGASELRVFNQDTQLNRVLGTNLNPGFNTISSMALDLNQNLWIGTGTGIFFIPFVNNILQESTINLQQPFDGNRPLLGGSQVSSIAIGPDQSVYIGTEREGLWQYNIASEAVANTFTANNSPLMNNQIKQVSIDWEFGELFIIQDETTFSLRTGTNRAAESLTNLKIYPNPVRPDYTGLLSIEGLTDFATVKITTSVGRVVFSTTVRGGQVAWNIREVLGGSLQSGVYLVFVLDEDGTERIAGKFVVI